MEKYARQALSEGVKASEELAVTDDCELLRVLNLHYNRSNQIPVSVTKLKRGLFKTTTKKIPRKKVTTLQVFSGLLIFHLSLSFSLSLPFFSNIDS